MERPEDRFNTLEALLHASGTPTVQFTSDNSLSYTNQSAINNVFQGMLPGVTENLDITLQNNNSKLQVIILQQRI